MNLTIFKPRNAILILLIFSVGLYYHTMNAEILSVDDFALIYGYNNNAFTFKDFFFPNRMDLYYRPIVLSSFLIDYFIWRDHESGFHLTNMAFHAANVILVYILCLFMINKMKRSRGQGDEGSIEKLQSLEPSNPRTLEPYFIAFFAAFLFAVHPINTEAVNFIAGRTDILATFFILISFLLFLYYKKSSLIPRPSSLVFLFLSVLAYLLAILSKEVALTFPLIIMVYEFFLGSPQPSIRGRMKSSFLGLIIFTIPTVIYFYLRSIALSGGDISVGKTLGIINKTLPTLFFDFAASTGFYLKKLLYPYPLNLAIIQINKGLYFFVGIGYLVSLFVLGLLWLRLAMTKKEKCHSSPVLNTGEESNFSAFLLWSTFLSTLPAIAISITPTAWTPYAERYLYLPSVFFCILIGYGLWAIGNRLWAIGREQVGINKAYHLLPIAYCLLPIAYCLWFSVATYKRNIVWLSNLTIWEDTIKKSSTFGKIYNEYGAALMRKGEKEKAKEQFLKGIELGYKLKPLYNLGLLALKDNELDIAEKYFNEGIRITPEEGAYRKLAAIYFEKAEKEKSSEYFLKGIESYEKAYKLDKSNDFLALRLAGLYHRTGRYKDARDILHSVINKKPEPYIEKSARKILNKVEQKPD